MSFKVNSGKMSVTKRRRNPEPVDFIEGTWQAVTGKKVRAQMANVPPGAKRIDGVATLYEIKHTKSSPIVRVLSVAGAEHTTERDLKRALKWRKVGQAYIRTDGKFNLEHVDVLSTAKSPWIEQTATTNPRKRRNPDFSGALTIAHEASGDVVIRHVAHNPRKLRRNQDAWDILLRPKHSSEYGGQPLPRERKSRPTAAQKREAEERKRKQAEIEARRNIRSVIRSAVRGVLVGITTTGETVIFRDQDYDGNGHLSGPSQNVDAVHPQAFYVLSEMKWDDDSLMKHYGITGSQRLRLQDVLHRFAGTKSNPRRRAIDKASPKRRRNPTHSPDRYISVLTDPNSGARLWQVMGHGGLPETRVGDKDDAVWSFKRFDKNTKDANIPVWDGNLGAFTTLGAVQAHANPARRRAIDKASPKRRRNPSAAHAAPSVSAALLDKISDLTERNDHTGALLVLARYVLKSPTFAKKVAAIKSAQDRVGYLPHDLSIKRSALSARMFAQAKRRLSAADYALLRRSF